MYSGYKIVRVGAQYEITRYLYNIDLQRDCSAVGKSADCKTDEGRDRSNLVRARRRVYELCACNSWDWFCTFTLRPEYDRSNLVQWRKDFSQWLRNVRRLTGCDVKYVLVPEQHKNGCWHMHGLFRGLPADEIGAFKSDDIGTECTSEYSKVLKAAQLNNRDYKIWRRYNERWGYCSLAAVRDSQACARYISKYISKQFDGTPDKLRDISKSLCSGQHLYYASQGLKGAETVAAGALIGSWDSSGLNYWCNDYIERWTTDDVSRLPVLCRSSIERNTWVDNLGIDNSGDFSPL